MSDEKAFDFSIEIDPDYVRQTNPDPNKQPARITTKKAWFKSLLIPVLAILASAYPIANALIIPTTILGLIFGGIVPLVMIIRGRIDTSKFFLGKMILLAATVGGIILVVALWQRDFRLDEERIIIITTIITPIVLALTEIIFAAVQKTDIKTKLCLALSSVAWVYLGATLNFPFFWLL